MRSSSKTVDMLNGPVLPQILRFSMPLAATGILQLLFNAADAIVVGKFAGSDSLAAVGTTGSLINLLVGLFMGLSVGVNVLVARGLGCQDEEDVRRVNHSGVALSLLLSAGLVAIGLILSKPLLRIMDTPEEILPLSQQYLNIYFLGTPFSLLYNFLAASLRACGDTKRPLYFLTISGLTNVVLNLFFVIVLEMGVAGVAIATVISQGVSVALIVLFMMRMNSCLRLEWKRVRIDWSDVKRIVQIGIPAGLQGVIFSISNVMIQSSVNSFGSSVIAANTASGNLDGFIYNACNSVYHAAITFTSQNLGARKYSRIRKVARSSTLAVMIAAACVVAVIYFGRTANKQVNSATSAMRGDTQDAVKATEAAKKEAEAKENENQDLSEVANEEPVNDVVVDENIDEKEEN